MTKELISLINNSHDSKGVDCNKVYDYCYENNINCFEDVGGMWFEDCFVSYDYLNGDVDVWDEIKEW